MRWVEDHWGTKISLELDEAVPQEVLDDLTAWFMRVDRLFSTWRDDSEIMRLAAGTLLLENASSEVRSVLSMCDRLWMQTGGAFDIRVGAHPHAGPAPGRSPIDPSGYVKGWALERAADRLSGRGYHNYWISAGGDVLTRGGPSGNGGWRVGIQHPWVGDRVADVVQIDDGGAVATSGRYERGDHVLDPKTGQPATAWMSVTVVGPDLGLADAYATAAMAMGADGLEWLAGVADVEAMGIADNRMVVTTQGFPSIHARSSSGPDRHRASTRPGP